MMAEPHDGRLLRHGWRSLLILLGAWTAPAVMVTVGIYAIQRGSGQVEPLVQILLRSIWFYWLFAAICPLIYWMNDRLPFSRGQWPRSLLAHVGSAALVTIGVMALSGLFGSVLSLGEEGSPIELIKREFTSPQGQFQTIVYLFYYVMVVGAMMIVRLSRQRQQEEERGAVLALRASQLETQVTVARLKALETQLNPHFLFNALNSIASLVQQQRSDQAYEAIAILGELLRAAIHAENRHTIPLRSEMELLEKYLDIERMRFSDRMRVSIDVSPDCYEAAVPAMILQPLVENAIRHGFSAEPEAGLLEIGISREDARVVIEVKDDGPGLPEGWSFENDTGVGLQNLRERLSAHFGSEFELSLRSLQPRGVVARAVVPYRVFRSDPS